MSYTLTITQSNNQTESIKNLNSGLDILIAIVTFVKKQINNDNVLGYFRDKIHYGIDNYVKTDQMKSCNNPVEIDGQTFYFSKSGFQVNKTDTNAPCVETLIRSLNTHFKGNFYITLSPESSGKGKQKTKKDKVTDSSSRQLIYFGAPGTGKSHQLQKDAEDAKKAENTENTENTKKEASVNQPDQSTASTEEVEKFKDRITRVTFYPGYSYQQFVGTYKPQMNGDKITYKYVPGPLLKVLVNAFNDEANDYLLIIEELNRTDAAAAFGDMFQLLDRSSEGESEYAIDISEDLQNYLYK